MNEVIQMVSIKYVQPPDDAGTIVFQTVAIYLFQSSSMMYVYIGRYFLFLASLKKAYFDKKAQSIGVLEFVFFVTIVFVCIGLLTGQNRSLNV